MQTLARTPTAGLVITALVAAALALGPAGAALAAVARPDAAGTVWLCRPGLSADPCAGDLATDVLSARGVSSIVTPALATAGARSKVDCFYVYPTVSGQTTPNADLTIEPSEIATARAQASRFSADCRVWAPMYRQIPVAGLTLPATYAPGGAQSIAYKSLLAGFDDYLAHFNKGRPIVFIGHSQGAAMLMELLHDVVDPNAKLRRQLVSAVLAGGNVTVRNGSDRGGSFRNIPACRSARQTGCVIAYSSYLSTPPATSLFGIPGQGVSLLSTETAKTGLHVLCVNPATFRSAPAALMPLFNGPGPPAWTSYPRLYTAQCQSTGGANVLHITPSTDAGDQRPRVAETLGAGWGLHLWDVNIALGNLVTDVASEEAAYLAAARKAATGRRHHR